MLKLIIAKTPNFLTKCVLWRRTAKLEAYGGRLLVSPGTLMSASVKQRVEGVQKPVFINIFFFQITSILIRSMGGTPIYMVHRYMTRDFKGKTLTM